MPSPEVVAARASPSAPHPGVLVAFAAAAATYLALVHWLLVSDAAPRLSLLVIVAPWFAALLSSLWSDRRAGAAAWRRGAAIAVVVGCAGVAWRWGDRLAAHADGVLFVENLLFLATLAGAFAVTLRPGSEALITRLARIERRGDMPPRVVRYTRAITLGWSLFFVMAATGSTILFFTQSRTVWSSFVNLALGPLVVATFVVEYLVRLRVLRGVAHGTLMDGVMAFHRRADRVDARGES